MKKIFSPDNIKLVDKISSEEFGISSLQLMENASLNASNVIKSKVEKGSSILIFCGSGNNGGDGFAIARHLLDEYSIKIFWIGDSSKMSEATKINFDILKNTNTDLRKITEDTPLSQINLNVDCIIDSLLGIGAGDNLRGPVIDILKYIKQSNALKIAIDNPSGLNPNNGSAHEHCFDATYTISMFASKPGQFLENGIAKCGEIITVKIGTVNSKLDHLSKIQLLEPNDLKLFLKDIDENISKFDNGRLAVLAGSEKMSGAAALVSNAAISSGCGLVELATCNKSNWVLSEIITTKLNQDSNGFITVNNLEKINTIIKKSQALAIGPGLGEASETKKLIREILKQNPEKPTVVDADALKVLDDNSILNENFVLTPHTGEMSKITGIDRKEIESNRLEITQEWAKKLGCTILLKGKTSIICYGENVYFNNMGNSGMATAGCGDVLTGIIASFLAQGYTSLESAIIGSIIHSLAGHNYTKYFNKLSLTASKLIDEIKNIKI